MAVPTWHLQSASWPDDGQEVYIKTLNYDLGPIKCVFKAKTLTYRPSNISDVDPLTECPWYFVIKWRAVS